MTPRSDEQYQTIRDERREQILSHALRVFTQRGFAGTRISDVAESAGLSQGLIYRYFSSKEDMYVAVIEQTQQLSNAAMQRFMELDVSPKQKLRIITEANLNFRNPEEYARRFLLMMDAAFMDSSPAESREKVGASFLAISTIEQIIQEGQARGEFTSKKEAGTLSTAYWSMIQGLVFFRIFNESRGEFKTAMPDTETIMKIFD